MSDILGYKGKRVIVSGCFSGMGEATAKILLDLGAEVHGLDFKPSALPLGGSSRERQTGGLTPLLPGSSGPPGNRALPGA